MRHLLAFLMASAISAATAQTSTGDYHIFRKHAAVGDSGRYVPKVNNSLWSLNANGMLSFIAQSNFVSTASIGGYGFVVGPSSATNNNVPQWDGTTGKLLKNGLATSTGGNQAADAGKLVLFNGGGGLAATVDGDAYTTAISAILANGNGGQAAISGYAENGVGGTFSSESATAPALECVSQDGTYGGPLLHAHNLDGEGMEMANDGSLSWTSATGAGTTRNNLLPSKTGNALKVLRVNAGETDYELATPASGGAWGSITGTLTDQTDLVAVLSAAQEPTAIIDVGSTNTTIDPGQNTMRFNSGTASSVTEIALSDVTSGSVDKGDLNSLFGGILQGRTVGTSTTFEYRITAAVHTSFTRYTVTYLKGSIPADNTVIAVRYIPEPSTGGSGTVTSVAVSGSDGIEVDSGSPVTSSGTIALGVNASALKTHLSLGNVENTALSTWTGSANITTLGTVATGIWQADRIGPTYGGTGQNAYALGDLLYADATDNLARLAGNTTATRNFLSQTGNGSVSAAPAWREITTSDVSGLGTLATQSGTFSGTHSGTSSGTNTGDQTSIVGITGTTAQFNTALSDGDFATGGGTATGTNTGDQTITLTGDVTGSGTGSFAATIATGVIVNADINASAAIALSKLATDPLARANHTGTQAVSTISDATTVGQNLVKLTNPSAITYPRINADNTVTARTMAQSRTDLALHPVTITAITGGSQSTTSTSLADVTGSTITFPDTGWYAWEYFIIHSSAATSTGAFFAVNTGGTMVNNYITYCISYDVLSTDKDTYCVDGYNSVIASTSSRATANNRCRMQGTIHVTTAGGMVLRFATEVNASAITVTDLRGWYRNL